MREKHYRLVEKSIAYNTSERSQTRVTPAASCEYCSLIYYERKTLQNGRKSIAYKTSERSHARR